MAVIRPWKWRPPETEHEKAAPVAVLDPGAVDVGATDALAAAAVVVIDKRRVHTLFQPLVHLATGEIVGYEALTRGPVGSLVESPVDLMNAARTAGRLAELDWMCAAVACDAALAAGLHPSMSIFLNFEPSTLLTSCPRDLLKSTRRAQDRLRIVVELKEDTMMEDPGRFFEALDQARKIGWGVAIDNAGASTASLALLPLSHPDVLKLDLRGLRHDLPALAGMGDGARVYAEQTGATVLAQGLETADDVLIARAAGATFGQGYYFGRPAPLPTTQSAPRSVFPLLPPPDKDAGGTPFEIISEHVAAAVTQKRFLHPLGTYLEEQIDAGSPGVLFVSFQQGMAIGPKALERLHNLVIRSTFTVAFGPGLGDLTWPRSRTATVAPEDRFGLEWAVIVLSPNYVGAVVARDLGDRSVDQYRQFDYVVTHDRALILRAAHSFLHRVQPERHPPLESLQPQP